MRCTVARTGIIIAEQVELAQSFCARLKGLMFRKELQPKTGLLLDPCPQIHTCFMRFNIDVVFLDAQNRVLATIENLKPWRMSRFYRQARRTLELPGGSIQGEIQVGEELIFN